MLRVPGALLWLLCRRGSRLVAGIHPAMHDADPNAQESPISTLCCFPCLVSASQEDGSWIQFDDDKMIPRKEEEVLTLCGEPHAVVTPRCGHHFMASRRCACSAQHVPHTVCAASGTVCGAIHSRALPLVCLCAGGGDWHMAYLLLYRAQRVPALDA